MKNAIAVLLALALLGVAYGATAGATGQVTISSTCGISLSSGSLNFGSMNTGDTSADQNTTVTNDGSVSTDVTVSGTDWVNGTNSFDVGQSHYALSSGQDFDSGMTALDTVDQTFVNGLGNGASQDGFFKLRIPLGQTAGAYTQDITFTSTC